MLKLNIVRRPMLAALSAALGLCPLPTTAFAQIAEQAALEHNPRFYERKEEGWFWYKEKIPVEEPEPEEIPEPVAALPTPEPSEPIQTTAAEGPPVFSAAWFRENLPRYKDIAWNEPTIENVRNYMYLQRYAVDRSEQFANTVELAVVGDPFLDEESRRPSATFASQRLDRWAGQETDALSQRIAQKAGIFFFYHSESDTSRIQAPILKMLEARDGFTVMPIAIDGKPLPDGMYPNFRPDDGQAEKLGVQVYPALYLVSADREVEPIAQGVMSLADLKHRIALVSMRRGWISPEEFNKTKPIMNMENNIAAILDAQSFELSDMANQQKADANEHGSGGDDANNFIPPELLSEFIRKTLQKDR